MKCTLDPLKVDPLTGELIVAGQTPPPPPPEAVKLASVYCHDPVSNVYSRT
jgi:hypothetical protein